VQSTISIWSPGSPLLALIRTDLVTSGLELEGEIGRHFAFTLPLQFKVIKEEEMNGAYHRPGLLNGTQQTQNQSGIGRSNGKVYGTLGFQRLVRCMRATGRFMRATGGDLCQ